MLRNFPNALKMGLVLSALLGRSWAQDYHFDSSISRAVLDNYLSHAVTMQEVLEDDSDCDVPSRGSSFAECLRFVQNTGTKFIGRAVYRWSHQNRLPNVLAEAEPRIAQLHALDSDIVVQAAIFEIVDSSDAAKIPIPAFVFTEFGQPVETRSFNYSNMIFTSGFGVNEFGNGASVPDISRIESKMWFFYFATCYIGIGCEAFHLGQVELMNHNDPTNSNWNDVLTHIRAYALIHARRHWVLCDGHVPTGSLTYNGHLLLDSHAFPLRIVQDTGYPTQGKLEVGYQDAIYGRSGGGISPSGWTCTHLPYMVEFDNFGSQGTPGQLSTGIFIWGWDEISWFANQVESYRDSWLQYATTFLQQNDTNGHLEMPMGRLAVGHTGDWYWGYTQSAASPTGESVEETIKSIWQATTPIRPQEAKTQTMFNGDPRAVIFPQVLFGASHPNGVTVWSDLLGRQSSVSKTVLSAIPLGK